MITYYEAMASLFEEHHPNKGWVFNCDIDDPKSLNGIRLEDGATIGFTWDDVLSEKIKLEAEYEAKKYQRDRKFKYDALNQFEMQFDDKKNGTTTWEDAIKSIKNKYPKPE